MMRGCLAWCWIAMLISQQTFRSGTERVLVDVRVTAQGKPVSDLDASAFQLEDNGARQHFELLAEKDAPLDVVLLADVGSANGDLDPARFWPTMRKAAKQLRSDDRMAVWSLSNTVIQSRALAPVSTFEIAKPLGGGTPPVYDGIALAMMYPSDPSHRRIVVIATNGLDVTSVSKSRIRDVAALSDAPVFVLFQRSWGFDTTLSDIAQRSGGAVIQAKEVSTGFAQVVASIRSGYVLAYTPTSSESGWHSIRVRVKPAGKWNVSYRQGYVRAE